MSNKGTLSPGLSPGILTVSGPYGQTASGHLAIQIGGTTAGTGYDQLAVTGSGALAGTIDLSTINGFTPALGQTYNVATFGSRTGTFANITGLLASEGATWKDIVRTTCYLRDIERDYAAFNEERTAFYARQGLDPLPASTGIQAILCRPELLIEIEAIAMFRTDPMP